MGGRTVSRFFTVNVVGHLLTKGVWRIDGALTLKDDLDAAIRDQPLGKGRLALVKAVVREGIRGRTHGATAVQVQVNVDGRISEFELGDIPTSAALPR